MSLCGEPLTFSYIKWRADAMITRVSFIAGDPLFKDASNVKVLPQEPESDDSSSL